MRIKTSRFGEINIDRDMIINFPAGIPGQNGFKRYFIIDYKNQIKWLHSVDNPDLAFIATEPFRFFPNYSFEINDEIESFLGIKKPADIAVLAFLSISDNKVTVNLKAPVVINIANKKAVQIKTEDGKHSTKEPLPLNAKYD